MGQMLRIPRKYQPLSVFSCPPGQNIFCHDEDDDDNDEDHDEDDDDGNDDTMVTKLQLWITG